MGVETTAPGFAELFPGGRRDPRPWGGRGDPLSIRRPGTLAPTRPPPEAAGSFAARIVDERSAARSCEGERRGVRGGA